MCSQRRKPNTDRISTLPDSIICHILSFLPTKLSATTTVLSKRWNQLWLSVLFLDFDDQNFTNFAAFRHFIYSVMLMRDTTLPIRSFRLKCGISPGFDPYDINRLLSVVVKRGIQNLILDLSHTNHSFLIKLSPTVFSVFNCRNLVVLKLKRLVVYHDLPQFDLPLLKTLHLDSVYFFGDFFIKFVKGCTILEEFQTTDFLFRNDGSSEGISFPNLVRANISMVCWNNITFAWICNAKFMRVELSEEQQVHTFHNLTHMELIFKSSWRTKWKWLVEVLEHCPKLQNLTLHKLYGHEVDEDDWKEPQTVPECISSQLRTCSLIAYKGTKFELQFAEYIIKNAKLLHTMTVSASPVDINTKHHMLMKLSLIPRGSTTCKLSFD